jgi:hypothetical protein
MNVTFQEIERLEPSDDLDIESRMLAKHGDQEREIRIRLPKEIAYITRDTVDPNVSSTVLEREAEIRASGAYPREARWECLLYGPGVLDLLAVPDPDRKSLSDLFG